MFREYPTTARSIWARPHTAALVFTGEITMKPLLKVAIGIAIAGAVGCPINALVTDKGIRLPCSDQTNKETVRLPGTLGSPAASAAAAVVT